MCVLATYKFFHAAGNVQDDNETRNGPFDDPEFRRQQLIERSIFILSELDNVDCYSINHVSFRCCGSHLVVCFVIKFLLYIRKVGAPHDDRPGAFPVALVIVLVLSVHPVRMRLVVLAKMNHLKKCHESAI